MNETVTSAAVYYCYLREHLPSREEKRHDTTGTYENTQSGYVCVCFDLSCAETITYNTMTNSRRLVPKVRETALHIS